MNPTTNKNLLIVGPHWPAFDRASGDLRFHRLLRMTVEAGYTVDFVGLNETDASGRYASSLAEMGMRLRIGYEGFKKALTADLGAVVFEYYLTAEVLLPVLRLYHPKLPVGVDSVDVHFHRERLKAEVSGLKGDRETAEKTYHRETAVYRSVERVVAVTDEDRRIIEQESGSSIAVDVVPNIHDPSPPPPDNRREPDTAVFIGSFSHQPNVDGLLFFLNEVWPRVRNKRPSARLWVIGAHPPSVLRKAADDSVTFWGFVEDVAPYLHRASVSVAPLRFGAGMKGKVAEAMAHETPVVMTSIGAQGMDLVHEEHAWIADTAEGLADGVVTALADPQRAAGWGRRGFDHVSRRYAGEIVRAAWIGFLDRLIAAPVSCTPWRRAGYALRCLTNKWTVMWR